MRLLPLLLVAIGLECLACASGGQTETGFTPEGSGGFGGASGSGSNQGGSPSATSGPSGSSGHVGPATGVGPASSVDVATVGSTGTGLVCDYGAPNGCSSAEALTSIDGDQNSDVRLVHGSTSKWYVIEVLEPNLSSIDPSFTAWLTSPVGMFFDLFVYSGDGNGPNCSATAQEAFDLGGGQVGIQLSWPDNFGSSDNRFQTLEVRYVSGTGTACDDQWDLQVQGNTAQ